MIRVMVNLETKLGNTIIELEKLTSKYRLELGSIIINLETSLLTSKQHY